eukprot:jgi/Galph1/852/GphlegSOOS_G5723.1
MEVTSQLGQRQWQAPRRLFEEDKLFEAARAIHKLEEWLEQVKSTHDETTAEELQLAEVLKSEEFTCIKKQSEECQKFLSYLLNNNEWQCLSRESERCQVYYSASQGPDVHGFKIETEINAPFLATAALINETDLLQQLFWYVGESSDIAKVSRCKKILKASFVTPWPFAPREAVLLGYAVDGLEEDHSVVVFFRTAVFEDFEENGVDWNLWKPHKNEVILDVKLGGIQFIPLGRHKTLFRTAVFADPKISYIPKWLFHWVTKQVCIYGIHSFRKQAEQFSSLPHHIRVQKDPFYHWIAQRLADYWTKQAQEAVAYDAQTILSDVLK